MIVELFGPPGVGKTTFAVALASFLRQQGQAVDPVMSYRPAEQARARPAREAGQALASVRRVARPVGEMMAAAAHLAGETADAAPAAELMRLLPPRSIVWSIRLRQYLVRLSHSWQVAAASRNIVLFDQAFVQAVGSLALLGRPQDPAQVARALDAIPQADLLIRLDAPRDVLAARLGERQRRQGMLERLLELDLRTNLASISIIGDLHAQLHARGRCVTSVDSAGHGTLQAGVERAGGGILAGLAAPRREHA